MTTRWVIGLDLGTQGVRALAVTAEGALIASASENYQVINAAEAPYKEQRAEDWENAAFHVLREIGEKTRLAGYREGAVLAVDGTSGTIVPLSKAYAPLRAGIMYNDPRAKPEADTVHQAGKALEEKLGYRFGSSFALPRVLWLKDHEPEVYEKAAVILHQSDYIVGRLTGDYRVTDYSNALKMGYDLIDECWPGFIGQMGVDTTKLPRVLAPGEAIGTLTRAAAERTGLPVDTLVTAGATDGYASCIAAGAVAPGQYNTTIGTTMVIKGVTKQFIKDPLGRVYCHKHPEGYWVPGGAGNVGGLCLNQWFGAENFDAYNPKVPGLTPTGSLVYPLTAAGERFPFVSPSAEGFRIWKSDDPVARYAGAMEGVAYVERLSYDTLSSLGCELGDTVMIAGGAVKAPVWSQIRADVLGKTLLQPKVVEAAMGAAVIAGTREFGRTLEEAAHAMVSYQGSFTPDSKRHAAYNELYAAFLDACRQRGYIL